MKNSGDSGVVRALAAFDGAGTKAQYRAAIVLTERLVTDPLHQLAMVDTILAARKRCYQ